MTINKAENRTNIPLVATTAVVGSAAGAGYAATHLSQGNRAVMDAAAKFPQNFAKEMRDSFNMQSAKSHMSRGNISKEDYNVLKDTYASLDEIYKKQVEFQNAVNKKVDFALRRNALSEANKSMFDFRKAINKISPQLMDKTFDLSIINKKKAEAIILKMKANTSLVKNAFYKPVGIGLLCGAFLGGAIGAGLSPLFNKSNK